MENDPIKYDILFGATYMGFNKIEKNYIREYGEIGAIMWVVYRNTELKLENKEKSRLLKKLTF